VGRKQLTLLIGGTLVLVAGVLIVAFSAGGKSTSTTSCASTGASHVVAIKNDKLDHANVTGKRCDTLTIRNLDDTVREVGFGPHDHHQPYDGVAEKVLRKNQSLTVTMVQTGSFHYHDHFHDEITGTFTVTP
jgi:hypothetical protein